MPLGNLGRGRLVHNPATYKPFPEPPAFVYNANPIKNGIYGYSSTGFTVMGNLPKRPSELLALMSAQYEEPTLYPSGQPKRGGRGKNKSKQFFHAHLTWYGVEYSASDTRDQLEDRLWEAMSTRPPPQLDPQMYEKEAEMRQKWISATQVEQARVAQQLTGQGYTANSSPLLAELTGTPSLTDDFFANPERFFRTHFPVGVSNEHVVVLESVDTIAEHQVWEWACDVHKLKAEKVGNNRGSGRMKGRFPDFVIGKDGRAVLAKANEIRQQNGSANGARYRPY